MSDKKQLHYYCVTGVLPAETHGRKWRQTKRWGVVATTPEIAGMQVRMNNEGVQIDSIQHRGTVDSFHECEEMVGLR